MSEKEFSLILWNNISKYLEMYNMTQSEFAKRINVATSTVSEWKKGVKIPRMDKIDSMCDLFHCKRSDLMYDHSNEDHYYIDSEAREYAEFLHSNPEYRILFSACRKVKKEDLELVKNLIDRMRRE